jgi:hypothetical protein
LQSGIASSFLAAINKQSSSMSPTIGESTNDRPSYLSTKSIPAEIRPSKPHIVNGDDHSLAASSVSGEDFAAGSTFNKQEISLGQNVRMMGKDTTIGCTCSASSTPPLLTKEMIDQMIEEKLQAKFAEVFSSLECIIREGEESSHARLSEMEKKLDDWIMTNTRCHHHHHHQIPKDETKDNPTKGEEATVVTTKSSVVRGSRYNRPFRR